MVIEYFTFSSLSAATSFVLGQRVSGGIPWKNKESLTLNRTYSSLVFSFLIIPSNL